MQLLLAALGGCSSVDIISILRKTKQELESVEIEVNGIENRWVLKVLLLFKNIEVYFYFKR